MAHPKVNSFTSYNLDETEYNNGCTLSSLNIAVIQNLRSNIAEEKLNLTLDTDKPIKFAQDEAYLRGQLDMLNHLLDLHEAAIQPSSNLTL